MKCVGSKFFWKRRCWWAAMIIMVGWCSLMYILNNNFQLNSRRYVETIPGSTSALWDVQPAVRETYLDVVRATYQCSAQSCRTLFSSHASQHFNSNYHINFITSSFKYLTTNTHTWRQIQNLNWSRCSEYGVRNWRHTRICGGCQIPISAGTAFVQKRLWSTSLGLNCFRASVAGAMFNFLSSLIRCV